MQRGELYRAQAIGGVPRRWRVYVIVSRDALVGARYSTLICAPVFSSGEGIATQVAVGEAQGLKHPSSIHCDNLMSVPKAGLRQYVGSLSSAKVAELDRALVVALDLQVDYDGTEV